MLPALARRAVETYSDPGGLVVDPMCGMGTTLVEAIDLGRRAIGVELEPRWARRRQHRARTRKATYSRTGASCRRRRTATGACAHHPSAAPREPRGQHGSPHGIR